MYEKKIFVPPLIRYNILKNYEIPMTSKMLSTTNFMIGVVLHNNCKCPFQ